MGRRPGTESDEQLLDEARNGDRDAMEVLLRRHHDRVLAVCRRLCTDPADAEDAAQEALVAIVRGLPRFDGRSQLSTWIYRVTSNCCLDELRRRRRRPIPVDDSALPEGVSCDPLPDDAVERASTRAELAEALNQLPDEFRVPLVLRDVADLDYAAIAEILELAPGTVRSRISRARARLADALAVTDPPEIGVPAASIPATAKPASSTPATAKPATGNQEGNADVQREEMTSPNRISLEDTTP